MLTSCLYLEMLMNTNGESMHRGNRKIHRGSFILVTLSFLRYGRRASLLRKLRKPKALVARTYLLSLFTAYQHFIWKIGPASKMQAFGDNSCVNHITGR